MHWVAPMISGALSVGLLSILVPLSIGWADNRYELRDKFETYRIERAAQRAETIKARDDQISNVANELKTFRLGREWVNQTQHDEVLAELEVVRLGVNKLNIAVAVMQGTLVSHDSVLNRLNRILDTQGFDGHGDKK